MAWMSDEQYEYMQDCKDKKITARSARNVRTHCGKRGAVKFPSDYMSKKEREAMNGECKSYRMNDPISWEEFKTWPKEHQETYIKLLIKKYNAPISAISKMFGLYSNTLNSHILRNKLNVGPIQGGNRVWDKEGFLAWVSGAKEGVVKHSETPVEETVEEETVDICKEDELVVVNEEADINIPEDDADHLLEEAEEHITSDLVYEMAKQQPNYKEQDDLKKQLEAFANDCERTPAEFLSSKHIIVEENEIEDETNRLRKMFMPKNIYYERYSYGYWPEDLWDEK